MEAQPFSGERLIQNSHMRAFFIECNKKIQILILFSVDLIFFLQFNVISQLG